MSERSNRRLDMLTGFMFARNEGRFQEQISKREKVSNTALLRKRVGLRESRRTRAAFVAEFSVGFGSGNHTVLLRKSGEIWK
jgi:hypothetical protein